ncbi:MAG: 50S ribosomal protein L17 [Sedimentisphaerales bacterium]|nr:50S ribosomal protein L17 [Sedimentisphaerales bacterium]
MRHRVAGRRLGRTSEHRLAMRRNMVASLFEHETIATTIQKAKEVKPFAEKLITLAKKGTLPARRRAISLLGNRDIVEYTDGKRVRKGTVVGKLFSELGPRYLDRPGGYTRIIPRALTRLGDNGQLVLLQLLGENEGPKKKAGAGSKKRSRSKAKETPEVEQAVESQDVAEVREAVEVEQPSEAEETARTEQPEEAPEAGQTETPEDSEKTE